MFWVDNIKHGHKYCVCGLMWKTIKIVNYKIFHDFLEIYLTPSGGEKVCILKIRNGESNTNALNHMMISLSVWQHIKIEVYGGDISIMGKTNFGETPINIPDHFATNCPFELEEDWEWVSKAIKNVVEEKRNSLESRSLVLDTNEGETKLLLKRCEDYIKYLTIVEELYNKDLKNLERGKLLKNLKIKLRSMLPIKTEDDKYIDELLHIYDLMEKLKIVVEVDQEKENNERYLKELLGEHYDG